MFPHKNVHLQTWISLPRLAANQTDHVMISRRHASNILDNRSQQSARSDTHHWIIRIKYRSNISTLLSHQWIRHLTYDISNLQDGTCIKDYCNSIKEYVNKKLPKNTNMEQKWSTFKPYMYRTGEEITSTMQPNDRNQWFDQESSNATAMSNTLQINMLQRKTRISTEEYNNVKR